MSGCYTGSGEEDAWHNQDFLPLPMSESYKLPSRKNRTRPEDPQHRKDMLSHDKPGRWSHDKAHAQDDPGDDPAQSVSNLRQQPGRLEQVMVDAGLDSSDDDDGAEEEGGEQEGQGQRKRKKTHDGQEGVKKVKGRRGAAGQQDQGAGSHNPFGALVKGKASESNAGKPNRLASLAIPCYALAIIA